MSGRKPKPLFRFDLTPVWSKRNIRCASHVDALDGIFEPDTRDVLSRLRAARQHASLVAESAATSRQDTNPVNSLGGLHLDPAEMVNCAQTPPCREPKKETSLKHAVHASRRVEVEYENQHEGQAKRQLPRNEGNDQGIGRKDHECPRSESRRESRKEGR